jgi:ketosteroid isomerase-like protein
VQRFLQGGVVLTKDELQAFLDRMARAYSAGDATACAEMFTENAQLHSPFAPPAIGRDAIRALHEEWTGDDGAKRFIILDYGSGPDLAWCVSRFSEGGGTDDGTSLIVLERQSTDNWLVRSCCLFGAE